MVTNRDRPLDSPQQNGSSKVVVHFYFFLPYIPIYCTQGVLETNKKTFVSGNRNKSKPPRSVSVSFVNQKQKFLFVSAFFGVSNLYRNNRNKQNCFEKKRNNPKFSEKYQNMLSFKLFPLVFCMFWFNRNISKLSVSV
jgi:hypothetical protein